MKTSELNVAIHFSFEKSIWTHKRLAVKPLLAANTNDTYLAGPFIDHLSICNLEKNTNETYLAGPSSIIYAFATSEMYAEDSWGMIPVWKKQNIESVHGLIVFHSPWCTSILHVDL